VALGEHELLELYDFRETLEATAAEWAARNATAADRELLVRVLKDEAACRDDAPAELAAINRRFHRALAQAAHNRFLTKTLNSLQDAFLRLRSSTLSLPGRPRLALDEHRAIVRAIERGDASAAAKAARQHIVRSRRDRIQLNKIVRPDSERDGITRAPSRPGRARSNASLKASEP
jgi:DNA-binding FadR family transcriptional regulator